MMASVAVLIGGLLMKYYQVYWVDSILTLLIALYLIIVGYQLLKTSTKILMLFTPEHIDIKNVVRAVNKLPKVNRLHHIHIWGLNDDEYHLEAHLDFSEDITLPEFNKKDPKEIIVQD